jgi:hypothetical protein
VTVSVTTDQYASEIEWILEGSGSTTSNNPMSNNQQYSTPICVDSADCHTFTITDDYGDGILGPGGFTVTVDNNLELSSPSNGSGWSSLTTEFGSCSAPTPTAPTPTAPTPTAPTPTAPTPTAPTPTAPTPTAPTPVTSCPSDQLEVDVEVTTDFYPDEIRYIFL